MANVKFEPCITITFSRQEFRLVGLALSGMITRDEDSEACLDLNAKILGSIEGEAGHYHKTLAIAVAKSKEEG